MAEEKPQELTPLQQVMGGSIPFVVTVNGEAVTYQASPLDFNDMVEFETAVAPVSEMGADHIRARTTRFLLWRALLHNHPDLAEEQVGAMLTLQGIGAVAEFIARLMPSDETVPLGSGPVASAIRATRTRKPRGPGS